jgi:hypothetical protein
MTDINNRADIDDRDSGDAVSAYALATGTEPPVSAEEMEIIRQHRAEAAAKAERDKAEAVPYDLSDDEAALIRQYRAEAAAKNVGNDGYAAEMPGAEDDEYQQFLRWKRSGKPDYRSEEDIAREAAMSTYDRDIARGAYSHSLLLADGTVHKHLAVDSGPVPSDVDGVPVIAIAPAAVGSSA